MSNAFDSYISDGSAAAAIPSERAMFIRRTYMHLAGAILAFAAVSAAPYVFMDQAGRVQVLQTLFGSTMGMVLMMAAFIGSGFLARYWARSQTSMAMQYAGLGLYVVVQAVIFMPLLFMANTYFANQHVIEQAAILTLAIFGGLSTIVLVTRKDFSFMGGALCILGWVAFGVVICAWMFGWQLGSWFNLAIIGLAAGYILYDTSNILHVYRTDQHVAASLELFASVALMFYHVLMLFMRMQSRD